MLKETNFTPFDSVLSKGFTDRDATAPLITAREGVAGLRDAYHLEKLQERQIKNNREKRDS
jgi:hypothetical protein